jgi:NitT/TauT family transport system substrate-binding protein
MKDNLSMRIGHQKIVDHLILGVTDLQLKSDQISLNHSNIEAFPMNSWDQVCDGLTNYDIDGAFITVPLAMDLFAAGLDIKILMFAHRSGSVIVKNKAANIQNISDFKGKTVLVPSELSIQNMLLDRLLSSAGLTFGAHDNDNVDVKREVVNPFLMSEMLMNDKEAEIAGFSVAEPFGSYAIDEKIAAKLCTSASLWNDHPCCVFVLNSSFIEDSSQAVEEIISTFAQTGQAIEQAIEQKKKDHSKGEQIFSMAQQFLDQKKQIVHDILLKSDIRFNPALLIPDIEVLNIIQNYMADSMNVLTNKIDMNLLVDSSYIKSFTG